MPTPSAADKAGRRAVVVYQVAIRDALAEGAAHQALNLALRHLQSEMAKVRRRRPAAGALTDAELAGNISALAATLHDRKPGRPPGCPKVPGPEHLLALFTATYASALDGSQS